MGKTEYMQMEAIRTLSTGELASKLDEKRDELRKLRMAWKSNTLENVNQVKAVRKDVARILTVLRERDLASEAVKGEGN